MMKKIFYRLCSLLLVASYSIRATAQQQPDPIVLDSCSVERFIPLFTENGKQSQEGYTFRYKFVYPKALRNGNQQQLKKVLDLYKSKIFSSAAAQESSIHLAIEKEIKEQYQLYRKCALETYQEAIKENESNEKMYFLCYDTSCKVVVKETMGNFYCFKIDYTEYTGGAHGMYGTTALLIDRTSLEVINSQTLFRSGVEKQLNTIIKDCALKQIIKKHQEEIPNLPAEELALLRSELESREVIGHENFYLDEKGITYIYNPYHIACYAEGIIEVFVPFKRIVSLLKPDILQRYFPDKYDKNNRSRVDNNSRTPRER